MEEEDYLQKYNESQDDSENMFTPSYQKDIESAKAKQKAAVARLKEKQGSSGETIGGGIGAIAGTIAGILTSSPQIGLEIFQKARKIGRSIGEKDYSSALKEATTLKDLEKDMEEKYLLSPESIKKAGELEGAESILDATKFMA